MKYVFMCKLKWARLEFYADGPGHAQDIMRALGLSESDWEADPSNPA